MIGRLSGQLVSMQPPWLLIDVHGVGYEVEAPMTTIYALPATGNDVTLFTHYQVREDAHLLYGFATLDERRLFRSLLKVSGVGAKLALTILSGIEANAFAQCVNEGDAAKLVQLPGVGKKTAERLIVEMRDRLDDWSLPDAAVTAGEPAAAAGDPVHDAVAGLIALGYKPNEASRYVHEIDSSGMSSEEIIRAALRALVR